MSVGFHSQRFPCLSTPNINEASSKDVTASLHRNVLSWGVWRGQEEKESVSLRAITHSASAQTADSRSYRGVSNLSRVASVPDVVERWPKSAFSSITIAAQRILLSPQDPVYPSSPAQPVKASTPLKLPESFEGRASSIPTSTMRVSNSQTDVCRQNLSVLKPNEFRQAYSPADGLAVRDQGKTKVQLVQRRLNCTESNRKLDRIGGSLMNLSSQPSYRSCIHLEVPLRSTSSVLFLDKSLSISLVELEERRAGRPPLYRSTLSVRLGVSSCLRSSTDNKPSKINEGYGRPRAAMLGRNKRNGRESGSDQCSRSPLSKHRGHKVEQIAPAHGVNSKADDSGTQRHSTTLGLLSFRGPSPSNTKAGRQKGNADEAAFPIRSNFRHRQHTSNIGPVDSRTWSKQAGREKTEEQQHDSSLEPQHVSDQTCRSQLKANSLEGTAKTLSLQEALELFRPDFISRSQGRVRRLEQRARRRKSLQNSNPDLVQGLREDRSKQKRNCTTPDPLSDNLFKPRERSISGREMQLRSRRIYNKLPEVTKKKDEEKKRAVSQTNRLRADVFKKRLLNQILHR
uniref:uncharacterized protein LOC117247917 n=1 Tax=Epinephelus lanceolatus TaxID=310571 RepID=UPI001445BBF0|nr:uncharacterized protein LOC117247917 [Epinephelus lanceolatus]